MTRELINITDSLRLTWERRESPLVVGMLHDICKANFYAVEMRNRKNDQAGGSSTVLCVDDKLPYGHGEKSVYIISGLCA